MEEKRKLPRKYLMAFSSVYEQSTGKMIGYLSDLTLDGLMVIGKESLPVDQHVELHIDLPQMPLVTEAFLRVSVRVVRSQPDLDPRLFNIGAAFLDLTDDEKAIITQMIETYEFRRENE